MWVESCWDLSQPCRYRSEISRHVTACHRKCPGALPIKREKDIDDAKHSPRQTPIIQACSSVMFNHAVHDSPPTSAFYSVRRRHPPFHIHIHLHQPSPTSPPHPRRPSPPRDPRFPQCAPNHIRVRLSPKNWASRVPTTRDRPIASGPTGALDEESVFLRRCKSEARGRGAEAGETAGSCRKEAGEAEWS